MSRKSIRNIRMSVGLLFVAGTSPQIIKDFLKVAQGQETSFGKVTIVLLSVLFVIGVVWIVRLKGDSYERLKPLWERPAAFVMLLVSLPVLIVAALLIRLESPGHALYRQRRIGKNKRRGRRREDNGSESGYPEGDRRKDDRRQHDLGGKPFTIYKLRSMKIDSEEETGAAWSTGEYDPRITNLGYYMRRTHLDEFPQFFNVLKGNMSLIGPRPERPEFISQLNGTIDAYRDRLNVFPGITGLAQIHRKHDETLEDVRIKLQYDKQYIKDICLLQDIRIVFRTIAMMFNLFWVAFKKRTIKRIQPSTPDTIAPERIHSPSARDTANSNVA